MTNPTRKPKILFFDIETTPNLVFTWELGKQYVNFESIYKERKISCICYKWSDSSTVYALTMNLNKHKLSEYDDEADKEMLKKFSEVYAEADLVVGHNAANFDVAHIKARLLKHDLPDIAPTLIDDTYLSLKKIRFNSHKLEYLGKFLGEGKKAPHSYSLWVDVMRGNRRALQDTVRYCKQDVILLENTYYRVLPRIKSKLNAAIFAQDPTKCPTPRCNGGLLVKDGKRVASTLGLRQRYRCTCCGQRFTTGKNLIKNSKDYLR